MLVELFSGLGAAALAWGGPVALAVDQNPYANATYAQNHGLVPRAWNLAGVRAARLPRGASRWWLSPPCQPFTVRGARRDLDDPRVRPLLRVLELITELKPPVLAMENVPGFVVSSTRGHLRTTLLAAGYRLHERLLCPTALGIPMRRARYYLVARLETGATEADFSERPAAFPTTPLAAFLMPDPAPELHLDAATVRAYGHSVHVIDSDDPGAVANCFTSAYGRSPVRAGSYLKAGEAVRRFAPEEVLRLLGFPRSYAFAPELPLATRWDLAGNSLSVDAVRRVLADAGVAGGEG